MKSKGRKNWRIFDQHYRGERVKGEKETCAWEAVLDLLVGSLWLRDLNIEDEEPELIEALRKEGKMSGEGVMAGFRGRVKGIAKELGVELGDVEDPALILWVLRVYLAKWCQTSIA
jgi:hypothetical protein